MKHLLSDDDDLIEAKATIFAHFGSIVYCDSRLSRLREGLDDNEELTPIRISLRFRIKTLQSRGVPKANIFASRLVVCAMRTFVA
jgi:hypothetical protein